MHNSRIMPRLCFLCVAALTLLGTALRTVGYLFFFDTDPGYFVAGPFNTVCNVLYFVAVAVAVLLGLLIPKNTLPTELHTRMRAPVARLLGIALLAFAVAALILCVPPRRNNVVLAPVILAIPAALYYVITATRDGRYPDRLSLTGYFPILWSMGGVADIYFDQFTAMNSPVKLSLQISFMGAMLIGLGELRFRIGRPLPRYSVIFWSIGSFTCLVGALPLLIATGAQKLDNVSHLLYAVVLMCAGLYGLYLLLRYTCFPSDVPAAPAPEAEAVEDEAAAREEIPTCDTVAEEAAAADEARETAAPDESPEDPELPPTNAE